MLELVVDNFAGGGGASSGIEAALGRIDIAINHDPVAIAIHRANHPAARHLCQNVWQVDPREATGGRPVGLAWFSPDCKHFSKAKGGKPVEKRIRDLAWVVIRWAHDVRPRVIMLENVEEFQTWGPLLEDGTPCPVQRGLTFRRWVRELRREGYRVEWRELRACDYGAPTIRKRLFLIARRDGRPIVWPKPTHGPSGAGLPPWRTAASCIDWSLPCPSIFDRRKPLAEATLRRIAHGVRRYVLDAARPFIVPITHTGDDRVHALDEPVRMITTAHRGELALCSPMIVGVGSRAGQSPSRSAGMPLGTVTCTKRGDRALVAAFLAQHNTGLVGHAMTEPVSTIVGKGCTQALVAAHMLNMKGSDRGIRAADDPLATICASTTHAHLVAAFLTKYFSTAVGQTAGEPLHTITVKPRFGLVTVAIDGEPWVIVEIGMRMLQPRELFRAQGFPDSYVIDPPIDGRPMTKTAQIAACGNSVCPPLAEALVRANFAGEIAARSAA